RIEGAHIVHMRVRAQGPAGKLRCNRRPGAPDRELVLETQKVEKVQIARTITVRNRITRGEEVLEAQEIEKIQLAVAIAVRVALGRSGGGGRQAGCGD